MSIIVDGFVESKFIHLEHSCLLRFWMASNDAYCHGSFHHKYST